MGIEIIDIAYERLKEKKKTDCLFITEMSVLKISKLIRLYLSKLNIIIYIVIYKKTTLR